MKTTISNITLIQAQSIIAFEATKSSPYPNDKEREILAHRSLDQITIVEYAALKTELNNRVTADNIIAPKVDRFSCRKRQYLVNSNFDNLIRILSDEDFNQLRELLTSNYFFDLHKILALISIPLNMNGQSIDRVQLQSDLLHARFIDAWSIVLNLIESGHADAVLDGVRRMRNKITKPASLIESEGAMYITI